ncbi:MAG: exo-alpha-sialidase, partial [Chloroflexales bacterium]|nr:exo-alpha-sialidase [Chloroflexales bacterium]
MVLSFIGRRGCALLVAVLALVGCASSAPSEGAFDRSEDDRTLGYSDQRKIVRDSRGALFTAYRKKFRQGNDLDYHIFVARSSDDGATWAVLNDGRPIESTGDYNQRTPAIAIDGRDVLHITWYGNDANHSGENDRQIKYVRSADGGTSWSPWVNVAEIAGYSDQKLWQEHPAIAVSDTAVYIIWQGPDEASRAPQAKLAVSRDGGASWQPWQNISPSEGRNRSRPTLAIARDGRLFALAYGSLEKDGPQQIVWTASADDGASWQAWAAVAPTADDQRHMSVALDAGDRLRAVWRQGRADSPTQVLYSAFDGAAWSKPAHVAPNALAWQVFPSIAIAGDTAW